MEEEEAAKKRNSDLSSPSSRMLGKGLCGRAETLQTTQAQLDLLTPGLPQPHQCA